MALRSKLLFIALFLSLGVVGQTQFEVPASLWLQGNGPWPKDTFSSKLEAYSHLQLGSNTVTAKLLNQFLSSSFIDESLKKAGEDRLRDDRNTLLLNWRNGARYQRNVQKEGECQSIWWIGVENQLALSAQFNADMYSLAMYGNARFEGEELHLEAGPVYSYSSNRISGGYQQSFCGTNTISTGMLGMSLVQVYDYLRLENFEARIFTAERGEFIEVDAFGSWQASDTSKRGWTSFEGVGLALQVGYEQYNPEAGWRWGLQAGTGDEIFFNKKGFTSIGSFNDTLRGINLTQQTLSNLSVPTDVDAISDLFDLQGGQGASLPILFWGSLYAGYEISPTSTLTIQVSHFDGVNRQVFQLHWDWKKANRWLAYGASMHYDTFRGYNLGLRAIGRFGKWQAVLSTDDALGWVLPGSFTGVSYHARLGYSF